MRSLALFGPTLGRVQGMLASVQRIKDTTFKHTVKRIDLEACARAFLVANLVEQNVAELQSALVEQQLADIQSFLESRDLTMSYDYPRKGFQMEPRSSQAHSHPWLHLRSSPLEKWDHPISRGTLYFHELKDLEKYFTITYPKNAPKFVHDIYRKNAENSLLDPQNPLGLPTHAAPLLFMLNFRGRFIVEFYCRYGNLNIRTVRLLGDGKCRHVLSGMSIPRPVQRVLFEYCQQELLLEEPELARLHRLSYIGGKVEEVEDHLRLYSLFAARIDP